MASYGSIDKGGEREPFLNSEVNRFILETTPISWFDSLTFNWFAPLLERGNKKDQLDPKDLETIPLPASCKTCNISDRFEDEWNKEVRRAQKQTTSFQEKQPSLGLALARAFGRDFIRAGFLKLIHDCGVFVGPAVLHGFIEFLRDEDAPLSQGLYLTAAVALSQTTMSFCLRHYFFKCYLTGLKMRSAIVLAVYKKALLLSSAARHNRSGGEIINFMTSDANRIQQLTTYLHAVWYSFLQISLAIYFLWQQVGPSCLGGAAVICIMIPVNKVIAGWMGYLQKKLMKARDHRVEMNSEVLSNMKVIKLQAWEDSFQNRITSLRNKELKQLFYYVVANCFSMMMWTAVPILVAVATFATYTLTGNKLDVANALTALALFDILRFPLFMLPQVINNLVEASVSFNRVREFLLSEEYLSISEGHIVDSLGVSIDNASFVYDSKKPRMVLSPEMEKVGNRKMLTNLHNKDWEISLLKSQLKDLETKLKDFSAEPKNENDLLIPKMESGNMSTLEESSENNSLLSLHRVNLDIHPGEMIAVVGAVGAGKSTLVNSILGEVRSLSGNVAVKGRLAYFPQMPFIMNDTVKKNITFARQNEAFDAMKYKKALSVCALEHDLSLLSGGDETEIGEKGITLSGGQKARVAMARAVYQDADIYLLDDPLAAVDAHVGQHMFQRCIIDELLLQKDTSSDNKCPSKKNIVILVTNAIQYLSNPNVSRIVVLDAGHVVEIGTYEELSKNKKSLFSAFLSIISESSVGDGEDNNEKIITASPEDCQNKPVTDVSYGCVVSGTEEHSHQHKTDASSEIGAKNSSSSALMTNELNEREKGHVDFQVYMTWIRAAGGASLAFWIIIAYAFDQGLGVTSKWWLTYWSRNGNDNSEYFLVIYACINLAAVISMLGRVLFIMLTGLRASRVLFDELLDVILKAPMSFFDTTPVGRIVNRFSNDILSVDEALVSSLRSYLATLSNVIGVIIVISVITPYFMICLIPILLFYISQQIYFTKTYRELKRLDSVNRSPLYALLEETLDGVSTIRAYRAQESLLKRMRNMIDQQQNAYFLTCTAQCWLAVRLELAGTSIILGTCLCAVLEHYINGGNETFAGLAGLSISFALSVTQSLNWSVRMGSDLEANMVSVERIRQYCCIQSEAPRLIKGDKSLTYTWPSDGEIEFSSVKLRYREGLPLVLKGLSLKIPARSKVGVVGRTGAGKSTLMISLLRLVELESGKITIDGIDTSRVGMKLLRSKIAVIPQDPVLFTGTVRSNLDPFYEYEDEKLHGILQRVGLEKSLKRVSSVNSLSSLSGTPTTSFIKSLSDEVSEGGSNFSVGQRQLLVISRALLCGAKIVIMDEATASVDAETDSRIQRVMKTEFKNATSITIAHRINTILDSDYILVMDDGLAAEFDSPEKLMKKGGLFKDLVDAWEEGND